MGNIGIWQIILILAIVLIIFGAGKLPRVMGDFAKGIKNFKAGLATDSESDTAPKPAEPPPVTQQRAPESHVQSDKDAATKG